jgi:hypothetical protein
MHRFFSLFFSTEFLPIEPSVFPAVVGRSTTRLEDVCWRAFDEVNPFQIVKDKEHVILPFRIVDENVAKETDVTAQDETDFQTLVENVCEATNESASSSNGKNEKTCEDRPEQVRNRPRVERQEFAPPKTAGESLKKPLAVSKKTQRLQKKERKEKKARAAADGKKEVVYSRNICNRWRQRGKQKGNIF